MKTIINHNGVTGIYKITNPDGLVYIGQSKDVGRRFKQHRVNNWMPRNPLGASMIKYGKNAHKYELLHECTIDELNKYEVYYIKKYNSKTPNGLNVSCSGSEKNGKLTTKKQATWLRSHGFIMGLNSENLDDL